MIKLFKVYLTPVIKDIKKMYRQQNAYRCRVETLSHFSTGLIKVAHTHLAALFYSDPSNMIQHVNLIKTKPRRRAFLYQIWEPGLKLSLNGLLW